jgi:hypothetical protein
MYVPDTPRSIFTFLFLCVLFFQLFVILLLVTVRTAAFLRQYEAIYNALLHNHQTKMSQTKAHSWKILAFGRGTSTAEKAEKHLHDLGYKNAKVIGLENDKASDDKLIELLKGNDWDGISFGNYALFFFK